MKVTEANRKTLLKLAWPLILASASDVIMTTVDTAFVGRLGTVQIAAVGLSGIFVWASYNFFKGTMLCVGALSSQNFGAGRYRYSVYALYNGLFLAILSAVALYFYRFAVPHLVSLMRPSEAVQQAAIQYTTIRLLGAAGFLCALAFAGFFRGIGSTRTVMKVSIFANLLNVVLDYFFIFTLGMGVAGAATATAISQTTSAVIYLGIFVFGRQEHFIGATKRLALKWGEMKKLLQIGIPFNLKIFSEVFVFFLFMMFIGRLGDAQLAATTIMVQLLVLTNMTALGVGQAGEVMVGQLIGSKCQGDAHNAGLLAMNTNMMFTLGFSAVLLLIPATICSVFNQDPIVINYFRTIVIFGVFQICFDGLQMVAGCCLEAAGDTKVQFYYMIGLGYLLFLPMLYYLTFIHGWGIKGAWLASAIFFVTLSAAMFYRFKRGKWKQIHLVEV